MNNTLKGLRRVGTVLTALLAVTATVGIPAAHAGVDDYCGSVVSVDGVYVRGCWYRDADGAYIPSVKFRIPSPLVPTRWSSCTVRIAVYKKTANSTSYVRKQTGVGDCLTGFQANSANNTAFRMGDTHVIVPEPKTCYYVMSRWYGTYNGQSVGIGSSGPFAYSTTICGPATPDGLVDDEQLVLLDTPETPEAPTVVPMVTVE